MSDAKITATIRTPSKKEFWLVKFTGVNKKKFCGKRGQLLSKYIYNHNGMGTYGYDDSYQRVLNFSNEAKYGLIAFEDNQDFSNYNLTFEKIKQLSIKQEQISYQFDFGWGNEFTAKTMKELEQKIKEKLKNCDEHIKRAKKSKVAIFKLLKEFKEIKYNG